MKLNSLSPGAGSRPPKKRLGRGIGSGLGKTSGKGHKGQTARAGGKIRAGFEGGQMPLQRRLPKVGFRSKLKDNVAEVSLYMLDRLAGTDVDFAALKAAGLVPATAKQAKLIKKGEVKRAYTVKGLALTAGAKEAIAAAGGRVE